MSLSILTKIALQARVAFIHVSFKPQSQPPINPRQRFKIVAQNLHTLPPPPTWIGWHVCLKDWVYGGCYVSVLRLKTITVSHRRRRWWWRRIGSLWGMVSLTKVRARCETVRKGWEMEDKKRAHAAFVYLLSCCLCVFAKLVDGHVPTEMMDDAMSTHNLLSRLPLH